MNDVITEIKEAVTGNIYRDRWSFEGKSLVDYSVDCAVCGREIALDDISRRKRIKTSLLEKGWKLLFEKWVCPNCCQEHHL